MIALSELVALGLTEGEVKVYLALVQRGPQTKTRLAGSAGVSSSKVYEIAERLIRKGLTNKFIVNGTATYSAASPKSFLKYIEEKEADLAKEKKKIEEIIPRLEMLRSASPQASFETYEGWSGFKTGVLEALEEAPEGSEISAIGAYRHKVGEAFAAKYHKIRTRKNISIRIIFPESLAADLKYARTQIRHIPEISKVSFTIFPDRVVVTSLSDAPTNLVIKHERMRDSFCQIFEQLWQIAKPVKGQAHS